MRGLISNLLDITKIDSGEMDIELELFTSRNLIDDTVSLLDTEFETKKLEVHTSVDSSIERIWGDPGKCRQIMFNLLSNAIKFSMERGRIDILMEREGDSGIRISIRDMGVGIPADDVDKVFHEFHQVENVRDKILGGTGLGLAIARRLVELQGGKIGVQSALGVGSTFWFTLPDLESKSMQPVVSETQIKRIDADELRKKRILVVEDSEIIRTMILDMLSNLNHEVAAAGDGYKAIEVALDHHPELIFMDMRMPKMDGIEATKKLRNIPEFSEIPIIALTADAGNEAIKEQLAAGCTDHLAKPILSDDLYAILEKYLGKGEERV